MSTIRHEFRTFSLPLKLPALHRAVVALAVWLSLVFPSSARAQYFFTGTESLPDSIVTLGVQKALFPLNFDQTTSSGRGKTTLLEVGGWSPYEKNPALLATQRAFTGSFWADVRAPIETLDAIVFIGDSEEEFENGSSAKLVYDAIQRYIADPSVKPAVGAAVERLLEIPRQMVTKVIGDVANPRLNGANLNVNLKARAGHWGFHLSGVAQTAFALRLGPVYGEMLDILLTTDFADSSSLEFALARLRGLGEQIVDPVTGTVSREALPAIYSLNYADLVASVGYGFTPWDRLDVGISARILNRRFSVDRIDVDQTSDLAERWLAGLKSGSTGLTLDLGAVYRVTPRFQLAATLQNLIPTQTLTSSYALDFVRVQVDRARDSTGQTIVNADGDTALTVRRQNVLVNGPAELALPFVADIGAVYRAMDELDFTFELADLTAQQQRYAHYWERLRFGAEYRFTFLGGALVVPVRMGLAEMIPTFGLGIGYRNLFRLDAGYFSSSFQKNRTVGLQLTVSW